MDKYLTDIDNLVLSKNHSINEHIPSEILIRILSEFAYSYHDKVINILRSRGYTCYIDGTGYETLYHLWDHSQAFFKIIIPSSIKIGETIKENAHLDGWFSKSYGEKLNKLETIKFLSKPLPAGEKITEWKNFCISNFSAKTLIEILQFESAMPHDGAILALRALGTDLEINGDGDTIHFTLDKNEQIYPRYWFDNFKMKSVKSKYYSEK